MSTIKKKYIFICCLLVLLVLIGIYICLWGTTEVREQNVSFKKLQEQIGEYITIPSCLVDSSTKCRIFYPSADGNSDNHVAKYTNFTLKPEYFIGFDIKFVYKGVEGKVSGNKGILTADNKIGYTILEREGHVLYLLEEEDNIKVIFDKADFNYSVLIYTVDQESQNILFEIIDNINNGE